MGFNVGVTALVANQAALQVIGHNIANVSTPGFSRQNVELTQVPGQRFGAGYFGKGVQVASVERAFNPFLTREANLTAAAAESANLRFQRLQTLEQLFPMGNDGIGQQLNGFLNAWADTVASPTNQTARGVVLTRAEEFASRLNLTARQLEELRVTTRIQIEAGIEQANRLTTSIGQINQRIIDALAGGAPPNDLFDQRDRLVADLNKIIQVNTLTADDGSLTVFVGGSVPVVLGNRATALVGSESVSAEGRYTLGFGNANAIINEGLITGGSLKGALTFYNDDVGGVSAQLGRLALATLELTNRQHRQGLDLNGNAGQDFFRALPAEYFSSAVSVVSGSVTPPGLSWSIDGAADAPASFRASDYRISFSAAGTGSLTRISDGHSVAFGPPDTDLTLDGLRFSGLNLGAANTEVLVRPFRAAPAALGVNLTSPSQLALSSPVVVAAAPGNSGNVEVVSLHRPAGASAPPAWSSTTVEFFPGGYSTDGGLTVLPFRSGTPIVVDGFALTLRGAPTVGDRFTVSPATGLDMRQNAGNGQALLALRDLDALDGYSLSDGYIPVFVAVSSSIQIAKAESEFSTRVAAQAETARANQAGVNLDEEAARLLQFQQAYQASARYLQAVQSVFETLLATFGR